jgi:hypothetical protein
VVGGFGGELLMALLVPNFTYSLSLVKSIVSPILFIKIIIDFQFKPSVCVFVCKQIS